MLDASSDALPRLVLEIRERFLGLDKWIATQPEDAPYGLAIVHQIDQFAADDVPMFEVDDDELRERARPLLPKQRVHTAAGEGILVVVPLQ